MSQTDSKTRFLQYLTGLAIAAATASPALAGTPPPRPAPAIVASKVDFAKNLSQKIDATKPMFADGKTGPYQQTFGEVWALQWPWWEIWTPGPIQRAGEAGEVSSLMPSEVFKLVSAS